MKATAVKRAQRQRYAADQRQLAIFAKALGHPARIAIVRFLAQRESCYCGPIVDALPLSQSTVSQHLQALRECGLITAKAEGVKVCYCLNPSVVSALGQLFAELLSLLENAPTCDADACCD